MTIVRQIADKTETQIKNVQQLARRSWLATLGLAGIALDSTEKTFNRCVTRGEKVAKSARGEVKKLNQRLRREQERLTTDVEEASDTVERKLTDVLGSLNVPTRRDLKVLDTRINQLNAQLRELNTTPNGAPLANYDAMNVEEVTAVLPALMIDDLYAVEQYEATTQRRVTVLREVERQIGLRLTENGEISVPFVGYDALRAEDVVTRMAEMSQAELRHVKLYEATHAKRVTVTREADRRIEAAWNEAVA